MERCLSAETLLDLATGKLSEHDREQSLQHLRRCRVCERTFYELLAGLDSREVSVRLLSSSQADASSSLQTGARAQLAWTPPACIGRFRLLKAIGRGGMGIVYQGIDTQLGRPVAIKFVYSPHKEQEAPARIEHEARVAAHLKHPNIVTVLQVDSFEGRPYLVYEYVSGPTLAQKKLPLPWREALRIGRSLTTALAYAHKNGVFHRDIKLSNLMEDADGTLKLVDFGLAKMIPTAREPDSDPGTAEPSTGGIEADARDLSLTQTGRAMGTPGYIAPEILRGLPATAQSDLYAVGVVLYQLCAGALPHPPMVSEASMARNLTGGAVPLRVLRPEIPAPFAAAVERCLAPAPAARFATAEELADLLCSLPMDTDGVDQQGEATPRRISPGGIRRRWLAPLLGYAAVAAIAYWAPSHRSLAGWWGLRSQTVASANTDATLPASRATTAIAESMSLSIPDPTTADRPNGPPWSVPPADKMDPRLTPAPAQSPSQAAQTPQRAPLPRRGDGRGQSKGGRPAAASMGKIQLGKVTLDDVQKELP